MSLKLKKPIVFVGLMGCGKTAIGTMLAKEVGVDFIDTDRVVEQMADATISEIFARDGEDFFRHVEQRTICRILKKREGKGLVVATGGGAFMNDKTRECVKNTAISLWLKADVEVLLERVSRNKKRPLLAGKDRRKVLENLIEKRYPVYEKADIIITSTNNGHDVVLKKAINSLKEWQKN